MYVKPKCQKLLTFGLPDSPRKRERHKIEGLVPRAEVPPVEQLLGESI